MHHCTASHTHTRHPAGPCALSLSRDCAPIVRRLIDNVRQKIDAVRESVNEAASSEGGPAAVRAKASGALAAARGVGAQLGQLASKGKGFVKLAEDRKEGRGMFAAPASGCVSTEQLAACSNGGDASVGHAAALEAAANSGSGKRRPWWLCCC